MKMATLKLRTSVYQNILSEVKSHKMEEDHICEYPEYAK